MFLFESLVYLFITFYFRFISNRWTYLQVPNVLLSIAGIIFLFNMPESPRFLISKHRFKEARVVFAWIGGKNGLQQTVINHRLNEILFVGENGGIGLEDEIS